MSGRREEGAGKAGSFAAGEGEGGRELQRKARRPAGARARKKKTPSMKGGLIEFG